MISLITAALLLPQQPAKLSSTQLLANVRKAVHYGALERLPRGLHITGDCRATGEKGSYSILVSPAGEYVEQVAGKLPVSMGFDGKTRWYVDFSGASTPIDPVEAGQQDLFVDSQTHGWLNPARHYRMSPGAKQGGFYTVKLTTADGFATATVRVSATTWLPQTVTIDNSSGPMKVTLAGYRTDLGLNLPRRVTTLQGGLTDSYTVAAVQEAPTFIRNPYQPLDRQPSDVSFDPAKPEAIECRRAPTGHLLVHPRVNGKDVGWFLLDTGAGSMVIDPKVAASFERVGETPAVGVGGIVTTHYRRVPQFTLGRATMKNLLFGEFDLGIGNAFGVKVAGIVGYDVLRRAVVEFDLSKPEVSLFDPAGYTLATGEWQPVKFSGRIPVVNAKFGARTGLFRIDTGANGGVIFHGPAVKKYNLLKGIPVNDMPIAGVGGTDTVKIGRYPSFAVGGTTFNQPPALFSSATSGLLGDSYLTGTIGHDIIQQFRLVFDYPNRRMAFLPTGG